MTSEEAAMFDPEAFVRYKSTQEAVCPNGERLDRRAEAHGRGHHADR